MIHRLAAGILLTIVTIAALSPLAWPHSYSWQSRDEIDAPPSVAHPLGTDALGRDRTARLLTGAQVSILLAPAAAALSVIIGSLLGAAAGFFGGWWDRLALAITDTFLTLPWIFALLTARALLPLNLSPLRSVMVTFLLLGLLGWPGGVRVVRGGVRSLRDSGFAYQARAAGTPEWRILWIHVVPNLRPILAAQWLTLTPAYLLAEANLGMLGLGVAEPLPSLGSLLAELENYSAIGGAPWLLAPAAVLALAVGCLYSLTAREDSWKSRAAQLY